MERPVHAGFAKPARELLGGLTVSGTSSCRRRSIAPLLGAAWVALLPGIVHAQIQNNELLVRSALVLRGEIGIRETLRVFLGGR